MSPGEVRRLLVGLMLVIIFLPPLSVAQVASVNQGQTAPPVEIEADSGIEWQRQAKIVIARGNARAVRGDVHVRADELRARYRERLDGSTQVWRLEGYGDVQITTPNETAYGEAATYDLDQDLLILAGGDRVRLITNGDEISAERQLEYSTKTNTLVARGNALAVQGERRLHANELTAHLVQGTDGKSRLQRAEAVDNVKMITPQDIYTGDRGTYNAETGIATLSGSVKITRGANKFDGCYGEVDLNSGVSRLFACNDERSGRSPVRGRIQPDGNGKK